MDRGGAQLGTAATTPTRIGRDVRVSFRHLKRLFESDEPPWRNQSEFAMLLTLAYYINDEAGGYAWPSRARLAKLLRMTPLSVRRILRTLESRGLIETTPGRGKRNSRYRLCLRGIPTAPSEGLEVSDATPGGVPTDSRGIPTAPSEGPLRHPDQEVSVTHQEVSGATKSRVPSLQGEEPEVLKSVLERCREAVFGSGPAAS